MKIEQIRARLGEIRSQIEGIKANEDTGYTDAQLEQIEALNAEFEKLGRQMKALEAQALITEQASASAGRQVAPVKPASQVQVVRDMNEKFGGFENSGAFFMAVKTASGGGQVHEKLRAASMQEKTGEDGGFLVPEEISTEIQKKFDDAQESLLAKANVTRVSGNTLTLPIDENTPWTQGVQAKWYGEGKQMDESKNVIGQASWKLHKLGVMVSATDELLEDATALESYIKNAAPAAITSKVNDAIVSGDGVGKPLGILQSGFRVVAAKESGQTADTIVTRNIIKMYSRLLPKARRGAVWLINAGCEEQLMTMKDDAGQFIYLAPGSQMNQNPYGMLMGLPVIPMMSALPQLGDEGDIVLCNLAYYYAIVKSGGVKQAVSTHVYFDRDKTAFKFTFRIDGSVPFKTPVSAQYGTHTASAFVTLEAR